MFHDFSVSFNPVEPKALFVAAAAAVVILTVWAYLRKLRGSAGGWRWVALGLRLAAILLCLLAALRPSVILQEKKRQPAEVVLLVDSSKSMTFADEVGGQTRWAVAKKSMEEALEAIKGLAPSVTTVALRFDSGVADALTEGKLPAEPEGRESQLGTALLEAEKRASQDGKRIARIVMISDFVSTSGTNPLVVARILRDHQVRVDPVGLGSENAGKQSRDIAVREITTAPSVFVKNQLEVRGTVVSHGYPGQPIDVEMYVEGQAAPVAKTQVKIPEGADSAPITGLKYIPQTPGEKMVTLKVAPRDGEFITTNNEISTFVTVLSGGLNVMFLQGPNFTWDYRYLLRSTMTSQVIQVEGFVIRQPAQGDASEIDDAEFAPGKYNVYVLSDLPASYLPPRQHKLLAEAVNKGAGLMMLGGRTSFGAGGWADTALADVLPVEIHAGDGQLEPQGGVKFVPSNNGLNSYILQIGGSKDETAKLWETMPPVLGTNRFSKPKPSAEVLAQTGGAVVEPLLVILNNVGAGRSLAYGGDTWVWPRSSEEGRLAHRKFWRNVIFWLSHKENEGDTQVKLTLDRRRIGVGQKLELTITARDAKGASMTGVNYETKVEREGLSPTPETVDTYTQGDEARGVYAAVGQPGPYKVTVIGRKDGQEIGRDSSRFLVYQDDRELENQSADLALARQIAEITGGQVVPHESLAKYLKSIDQSQFTEYQSPTEHKVWDNWPFLLIFTTLLTLEWWIRKRHGWV